MNKLTDNISIQNITRMTQQIFTNRVKLSLIIRQKYYKLKYHQIDFNITREIRQKWYTLKYHPIDPTNFHQSGVIFSLDSPEFTQWKISPNWVITRLILTSPDWTSNHQIEYSVKYHQIDYLSSPELVHCKMSPDWSNRLSLIGCHYLYDILQDVPFFFPSSRPVSEFLSLGFFAVKGKNNT